MWLFLTLSVFPVLRAYSPPRIKSYDSKVVFIEGNIGSVSCPVELEDGMFFSWQHNSHIINPVLEQRYRISRRGELKILDVESRDSGLYTCRAINGFGSADINVTVVVRGEASHLTQDNNLYPAGDLVYPNHKVPEEPHFSARVRTSIVKKREGDSVHFKCNAEGEPPPEIHWYKNFKHLAVEGHRTRRGTFVLRLDNLQESDSGIYTCIVNNTLGSIGTNFSLEIEVSLKKPEFLDDYPVNYSVTEGENVTLKCHVRSKVETNIKWLKVLSAEDVEAAAFQNLFLEKNDYHRVLNFTLNTTLMADGAYLNFMNIPYVKSTDAGEYVCCATNLMGYSTRRIRLHVIHTDSSVILRTTVMGLSKELMVVISALLVTCLVVFLLIYLVSRHCLDKGEAVVSSMASTRPKSDESDVTIDHLYNPSRISKYRYYQMRQQEEGNCDHIHNDPAWWSDCEDISEDFLCSYKTRRSWGLNCDIYKNSNAKFTRNSDDGVSNGFKAVNRSLSDV